MLFFHGLKRKRKRKKKRKEKKRKGSLDTQTINN